MNQIPKIRSNQHQKRGALPINFSRLPDDPDYRVSGLPRQIRAKTTAYANAARQLAFISNYLPHERDAIRDRFLQARYDLEKTILTLINKS